MATNWKPLKTLTKADEKRGKQIMKGFKKQIAEQEKTLVRDKAAQPKKIGFTVKAAPIKKSGVQEFVKNNPQYANFKPIKDVSEQKTPIYAKKLENYIRKNPSESKNLRKYLKKK